LVGIGNLGFSMFLWVVEVSAIAAYGNVGRNGLGSSN
jgi:hypothetical protein